MEDPCALLFGEVVFVDVLEESFADGVGGGAGGDAGLEVVLYSVDAGFHARDVGFEGFVRGY